MLSRIIKAEIEAVKHLHIAVIYKRYKHTFQVLSFGTNHTHPTKDYYGSIHAEHDAINNLRIRKKNVNKNLIPVELMVIKMTKNNKLTNSRPCVKCLYNMSTLPAQKGYRIKTVSYSNEEHKIVSNKLREMLSQQKQHMCIYSRKKCNYNPLENLIYKLYGVKINYIMSKI
ncbi:MAG: hypothetical protein Faunusvirus41_2 [Faunusvirus sp.]|uniref:CMP/dCMP-type deaminase domain-containing protein n=1 Tax=Faunusvirus sp. TaxID=2487766 RepID=A0A3G5A0C9_9VIRU|nr:MAG: hypothetical protein Faunusvirus41_2 [Faunusvirus sp.]